MSRTAAAALAAFGILLLAFGLLFLLGSAGQVRRLVVAGVGLASGAVVIAYAAAAFREAAARSPERIRAEILALAKREDGEISREEIASALGNRFTAADPVLDALALEGVCRRIPRGGVFFYTFPDLQPRLTVLRCDYCSTERDLNSGFEKCPSCGGPMSPQVAVRSLGEGNVFAMDEESSEPERPGRQE